MGITLWNSFFWYFLNSYIHDYLDLFDTPAPHHSSYTFTQQYKERKRKEKVIKKNSN